MTYSPTAKREVIDQVIALWRQGYSVAGIVQELQAPLQRWARHLGVPAPRMVAAWITNRRRRDPSVPLAMPVARFRGTEIEDLRAELPATLGNAALGAKVTP